MDVVRVVILPPSLSLTKATLFFGLMDIPLLYRNSSTFANRGIMSVGLSDIRAISSAKAMAVTLVPGEIVPP